MAILGHELRLQLDLILHYLILHVDFLIYLLYYVVVIELLYLLSHGFFCFRFSDCLSVILLSLLTDINLAISAIAAIHAPFDPLQLGNVLAIDADHLIHVCQIDLVGRLILTFLGYVGGVG